MGGRQASVTGNTANSETPAQDFARAFRSILVRSFDGSGMCVVMASSVSLMGPSSGQGQTAIRRRPIGGPSGLGQTVGHAPNDRH